MIGNKIIYRLVYTRDVYLTCMRVFLPFPTFFYDVIIVATAATLQNNVSVNFNLNLNTFAVATSDCVTLC